MKYPLKTISKIRKGKLAEEKQSGVPLLDMEYLRGTIDSYKFVDPTGAVMSDDGNLLVLWDGSNAGEFIKSKKGVVGSTLALISPNRQRVCLDYLYYACKEKQKMLQDLSIGMGIPHVNGEVLKNLPISLPSIDRQKYIASYLDAKNMTIDKMITAKSHTYKQLLELRQAVISNGIGARRGVGMKGPLHRVVDMVVDKKTPTSNDNIITLENVQSWTGDLLGYTDFESVGGDLVSYHQGDVLFNKLRPYLAKVVLAKNKGLCTGEMLVLRPKKDMVDSKYLFYFMLSKKTIDIVDVSTYGVKMPRANWEYIGSLQIELPSLSEQREIADIIEKKLACIDDTTFRLKQSRLLLEEYRSSLISNVMGGKVNI